MLRSFGEILDNPTARPPSLVGSGLLDAGSKVIIGGPEKAGKSLLATQLAICLATGQPWLGFKVPTAMPVLYVQLEISQPRLEERLLKQGKRSASELRNSLFTYTDFGFSLNGANEAKLTAMLQSTKAKVLILDPLYFLHDGDANSETDMAKLVRKLNGYLDLVSALVVVAHHSKDTQDLRLRRPGQRISGSAVLTRWPDAIFTLEARDPTERAKLEFTLRNAEAPPKMDLRLNAALMFEENSVETVVDGMTAEEYAKEYEITVSAARTTLGRYTKEGRLTAVESKGVTKYFGKG